MKNINTIVSSALVSAIALSGLSVQSGAQAAEKTEMEKCYGVVKGGKNDCKTLTNACVGHSMSDGQKDAFIALPKGTCERLVGGSLVEPTGN